MRKSKVCKRISMFLLMIMLVSGTGLCNLPGESAGISQVYATNVSGNDANSVSYATDQEKEAAKSALANYANNIIVINKLEGQTKKQINEMLSEARKHINDNRFQGGDLSTYVSQVQSQMDAVVAALPTTTSDFLALADNYQTPTVRYGETVSIILPVVNYSEVALSDVVVKPEISNLVAEWPFEPNSAGATKTIKSFPPYDNKRNVQEVRQDIGFTFKVRSDVMSGYYPIKFNFVYTRKGAVEKATLTTYVKTVGMTENGTLDGAADGDKLISKPRIIVTGFETMPADVYAGDTFTLTIHIQNTSKKSSVTNALFDMQAVEEGTDKTNTFAAFLPTSGSSSIYMDSIGPGATRDMVIEMSAKSDLAQKPYVLDVNMKYDTSEAVDLSDTASVSIPIYQAQRCETGDAEITPELISVGNQANVMFDVYNTGKTTLYNVWVKFEADSITGGDTYLGTIASGGTGSVDAMITGQTATMDDGTVKALISYENESGVVTTDEKIINLTVTEDMSGEFVDGEMGMEGDMNMGEMEGEAGGGILNYLLIIIFVVVIAVVVVVIVMKKRKNKKKEAADLADDLDALEDSDEVH